MSSSGDYALHQMSSAVLDLPCAIVRFAVRNAQVVLLLPVLWLAGCATTGQLGPESVEARIDSANPLPLSVLIDIRDGSFPSFRAVGLDGAGGSTVVGYQAALERGLAAMLARSFDAVVSRENALEADVRAIPRARVNSSGGASFRVELELELRGRDGAPITSLRSSAPFSYRMTGDQGLLAVLTGLTMFVAAPVTWPAKANSIQSQMERELNGALNQALRGLSRELESESFAITAAFDRQQAAPVAAVIRPSALPRERSHNRRRDSSLNRYGRSYTRRIAAVVGIDDYDSWPGLEGATGDAQRFAKALRDLGFDEIVELYDRDATRAGILSLLGRKLPQISGKDDLVVVYFSGHGQTETLPNGQKRGYLIPSDGSAEMVYETAISMDTLRDTSNRLAAKHVYFAMDSCYSGLGLVRGIRQVSTSTDGYIEEMVSRRAVQMVTAGGEGEAAIEFGGQGLFTAKLLEALQGEADFNSDGFVTANEIGAYVKPSVSSASRQRQTPQFGTLEGSGEIVFELPQ